MSGCECKPDAKRKRDSAQPEADGAAIKKKMRIVLMVSIVSVVGVTLLAVAIYLIDKSADRHDRQQDH
jgi:cytochrome c-type biogenesis protein CcmH/NrfG